MSHANTQRAGFVSWTLHDSYNMCKESGLQKIKLNKYNKILQLPKGFLQARGGELGLELLARCEQVR